MPLFREPTTPVQTPGAGEGISRRSLLGGALVAFGTLAVAGCAETKAPAATTNKTLEATPIPTPVETSSASPVEKTLEDYDLPTPDEFLALTETEQKELLRTPESALSSQDDYTKSLGRALTIAYNGHLSYKEYDRIMTELAKTGDDTEENYRKELVKLTMPYVKMVMPSATSAQYENAQQSLKDGIGVNAAAVHYYEYIKAKGLESNAAVLAKISELPEYHFALTIKSQTPGLPVTDKPMRVEVSIGDNFDEEKMQWLASGNALQTPIKATSVEVWSGNYYDKVLKTASPTNRQEA